MEVFTAKFDKKQYKCSIFLYCVPICMVKREIAIANHLKRSQNFRRKFHFY